MMKKVLVTFLCVLILSIIPFSVCAHPGRTSSDGGHWDYENGEYHYHHGYSAHDHYDKDGDGDVDCPYNFNDKTGITNGGGTSDNSSSSNCSNSNTQIITKTETINKNIPYIPSWLLWIFALQLIIVLVLFFAYRSKAKAIVRMTYEHKNTMDVMQQSYDRKLTAKGASEADLENIRSDIKKATTERDALLHEIAYETSEVLRVRRLRCMAKEAPLDISFTKKGMPVYWKPNNRKPYGDYTVFVSTKSNLYHTDYYCSGCFAKESHIFDVIGRCRPCKKCA